MTTTQRVSEEIPPGYRKLEKGTKIEKGDFYFCGVIWNKTRNHIPSEDLPKHEMLVGGNEFVYIRKHTDYSIII